MNKKSSLLSLSSLSALALAVAPSLAYAAELVPLSSRDNTYLLTTNQGEEPVLADAFIDGSGGDVLTFPADDTFLDVAAPFPIRLFNGLRSDALQVHDNGVVTSGCVEAAPPDNSALPAFGDLPCDAIAPFWDDLVPDAGSELFVLTQGAAPNRTFVIQWNDMAHASDAAASLTFQVVFFEGKEGEVLFQYGTMSGIFANASSATIGIQGSSGLQYVTASVDTAFVVDTLSVDFDVDTDHDGLSTTAEDPNRDGSIDAGETNPFDYDSDDGGAGDGVERLVDQTDPTAAGDDVLNPDSDSDGVPDSEEQLLATNPSQSDTDGDGTNDLTELVNGSDPRRRDSDRDLAPMSAGDPDDFLDDTDSGTVRDGIELLVASNPTNADDDSDVGISIPGITGPVVAMSNSSSLRFGNGRGAMMSADFDSQGNLHVMWSAGDGGNNNGDAWYSMVGANGQVLIDTTFVLPDPGHKWHRLGALSDGRVGIVSAAGSRFGSGELHYTILDPSLDDRSGDAADPGTITVSSSAIATPVLGAYKHVHARVADDVFHVYVDDKAGSTGSAHSGVHFRINGLTGSVLDGPTTLVPNQGAPGSVNDGSYPVDNFAHNVYSSAWRDIHIDGSGSAHIIHHYMHGGYSGSGPAEVSIFYGRVNAAGVVERLVAADASAPNRLRTGLGHPGSAVLSDGNELFLIMTRNMDFAGGRVGGGGDPGELIFERYDVATLTREVGPVLIDGPRNNGGIAMQYGCAEAEFDNAGNIHIAYWDNHARDEGNGAVRYAMLGREGQVLFGPITLVSGNQNNAAKGHGHSLDIRHDAASDRIAVVFPDTATTETKVVLINPSELAGLGSPRGLANLTAASGGSVRVEVELGGNYGAGAEFGAGVSAGDGLAVIEAAQANSLLPVNGVLTELLLVRLLHGATLEAGQDFTIRFPAVDGVAPERLRIAANNGTSFDELVTTIDTTTLPNTVTATASTLGVFGLTVQNTAPTFTSTADTSAIVDEVYSYDADATDADGDTVTFGLATAPAGMSIDSTTGQVSWTPMAFQEGNNTVTVAVTDGFVTTEQSFVVAVAPATDPGVGGGGGGGGSGGGCGCRASEDGLAGSAWLLLAVALSFWSRRRRRSR